ncbi:MAG: hypothetical protein K0B15_14830 [Lentimicrobium sp.]|nr:hypothetical protein [Lentimicrobium sp.]
MSGKEINLIREIMDRLNENPFDLQSWKTNAIMILGRIFGENSRKTDLIRSIQPDYSSWSLRDATGRISQIEECKKMAREVLEASIAELEAFGLPEKTDPDTNPAIVAMEEYVTVKQSRDIIDVLKSDITREEKLAKITTILKNLDQVDLLGIVAKALVG